ncbi:MAG: hypothetical protein R3A47_06545 [Polyangiales bacterium]
MFGIEKATTTLKRRLNFDLSTLNHAIPGLNVDLKGITDMSLQLMGDLETNPAVVAEGSLRNATVLEIPNITAAYLVTYSEGVLEADTQVDMATAVRSPPL